MSFYATIARYYDAEHQDKTDDLQMYSRLAKQYGGPIFEVASGTGRVMFHLAQEGYEIHGIDIEPAMVDRAKQRLASLPQIADKMIFYVADMLTFETQNRFKLVLAPYGALLHFHEQEKHLEVLRRLRRLIRDDGVLVLDLPNPAEAYLTPDHDLIMLDKTYIDPETKHLIMQSSVTRLDRNEQLLHVMWMYDEVLDDGMVKRTFAPVTYRYFFYYEMRLLLRLAGFDIETTYGTAAGTPFEKGCPRMIILAKPV